MQADQAPENTAHRLSVTQPTWKEPTMNHSQPAPSCPQCGAKVYRTHTCRTSALRTVHAGQLPEPGQVAPAARPLQLVPMPEGWREQARELVATWPDRAQLHLVEEPDLDWGEDTETPRGQWPEGWPTYDQALTEDNGL